MARLPAFVSALPNDRFLVNAPTGLAVDTGLFKVHGAGVVAVLDPSDLDDVDNLGDKAVREALNLYLGSGNDGGLAWIPAPFADAFAPFVATWLTQALEREALNLGNGALSEAFVLYPLADGLVVGLIDPECGTSVFDDLLAAFAAAHQVPVSTGAFDPALLFSFEDCHLSSNLRLGRSSDEVDGFLVALYRRGLLGDAFVLGEELPEGVVERLKLDGRKVTVTGTFGVSREELEGWLEGAGAVITGTPVADGLLLVGEKPGQAKLDKAGKVGTERLTMAGLIDVLVDAAARDSTVASMGSEGAPAPVPEGAVPTVPFPVEALSDSVRLIDGTTPLRVRTAVFHREAADRAIVAFDAAALDFDVVSLGNGSATALQVMLDHVLDCNPDGGVLWVPAAYEVAFCLFAAQVLREAVAEDGLTFDNGGVSEGFFVHTVEDGLAVLLFDPEGGTGFFEDTIARFAMEHRVPLAPPLSTTFDPTRLQWFEDSHLFSNLALGRRTVHDAAMLLGLYERGVLDERFALDLNVRLHGDLDAFFRNHPVAHTGDLAAYPRMTGLTDVAGAYSRDMLDGYLREWLGHTAHATVVEAPVVGGVLLVGHDPDPAVLAAAAAVGCPTLRAADLVAGLVRAFIDTPRSRKARRPKAAHPFDLED